MVYESATFQLFLSTNSILPVGNHTISPQQPMWIELDRLSPLPLVRQLYQALRQLILTGVLPPGRRLPASRELATCLAISRNVVVEAYDLLLAEGFLTARRGSGTYVGAGANFSATGRLEASFPVSQVSMGYDCPPGVINFRAGTPDLSRFPSRLWLAMIREVLSMAPEKIFAYGHPQGREELRGAICDYVVGQRQVACHPEQIIITGGTTQAINIACHLLLAKRQKVIIEDPITRDIRLIISNHGGKLHQVAVDSEGLCIDQLPEGLEPAFVYVTPSHQFPIGGTMPIQRRIDLLRYAERTGAYLVEDDYDSEFRYDGPPLASLQGLLPDRVVYIGTFSKTLCPALRIGYLILPPPLIDLGRSHKWLSDLHNEVISQLALARFIEQGHYLRHLQRMRKHYRKRRQEMVKTLEELFGSAITVLGSDAGLHLVARFPGRNFTPSFFSVMEDVGVRLYSVAPHTIAPGKYRDHLLLGYGNLDTETIRHGLSLLARHFDDDRHRDAG